VGESKVPNDGSINHHAWLAVWRARASTIQSQPCKPADSMIPLTCTTQWPDSGNLQGKKKKAVAHHHDIYPSSIAATGTSSVPEKQNSLCALQAARTAGRALLAIHGSLAPLPHTHTPR